MKIDQEVEKFKKDFLGIKMETLEVIFEDIFYPVIQDIDTENADNDTFLRILKMIENL